MSKQYYVETKDAPGKVAATNGATQVAAKVAYIDDQPYEIKEGETILALMKRIFGKKSVPTLCDAPNLDPFGSCRVCSVDVALVANGPAKAQASCHTPVMPNSYIYTHNDRITK